jgi:hypothetical protein
VPRETRGHIFFFAAAGNCDYRSQNAERVATGLPYNRFKSNASKGESLALSFFDLLTDAGPVSRFLRSPVSYLFQGGRQGISLHVKGVFH